MAFTYSFKVYFLKEFSLNQGRYNGILNQFSLS
jgi:hypothetical protein